ncbi:MAG: glycosyltransferase family 2 protein [Actinomycetota bacterium]
MSSDPSPRVPLPSISAVICTRNRPVDLERTLVSLAWQTHRCHEILVIDDSDHDRRDETEQVCSGVDADVKILTKDTPGLTASRNLGIETVTGDVTMFFDDDVVLRPDYLHEIASAFAADDGLAAAGGSIDDDHIYGFRRLRALVMIPGVKSGRVYRSGWSSQTPFAETREIDHLIGCNMAYRTSVMTQYRFDDDFRGYALGEDLDFSHRLRLDGHRILSVGTARLWHLTGDARHDRAWGYREMVIRPIVAGEKFNRAAFLVSATTFLLTNSIKNRERARGNLAGIADVMRRRKPRDIQTLQKGT